MSFQSPSQKPRFTLSFLGCLLLLAPFTEAQVVEGQRPPDKPGLALVKPQAWSQEDQATVLEFLAFTNHSGYYEFRTAKVPNYQVAASKVVKLLIYPDTPQSLSDAEQRAALQKIVDEYAALSVKFPGASRQLEKAVAPLKSDAAKYDAGSVKDGGQWLLRSAYYKQKALILANLLRPELMAAPKIKEVDLTTNQYYLGLQDLAKAEPSVKPTLESMRSLYDSLVRKVDRETLLNQLVSPTLAYDQAVELVKQLKALKPGEDARANLFVQSWDTAVAKAGQLTTQITDVQKAFETAMTPPDDSGTLPTIPPDLAADLDKLSDAVKQYRAGSPPSAIQVPLPLADAMTACEEKFPGLAKQIKSREYLDAKLVLDSLANKSDLVGPQTSKALAAVQKKLTVDIDKFQVLRNEGKMLAENDKIEEALKKYQQAYAIIPAKEVAAQIDKLKKQ